MPRPSSLAALAALVLAFASTARTEEEAAEPKPEPKAEGKTEATTDAPAEPPKLAVAAKGPFAPEVEAGGSFAPETSVEVLYKPRVYGAELEVVEAAPAGPVAAGATLVRFDTTRADEQIRAAEADLAVAKESLAKSVEEEKLAQQATGIALERAKADAARSEEAYRQFHDVEAPLRRLESEHRVQGVRDNIVDQEEELAQLEKMYTADELTEETEEIVLKRSKRQLSRSRTSLGFHLQRQKMLFEVELPREDESLEIARRKAAVDWERAQATAPLALAERRLELEKSRAAFDRQSVALERLRADREGMRVVAPVAGVAVPGAFWEGKWVGLDDTEKALRPGRRLQANQVHNQVLYTVYAPGGLRVRTTVPEALVLRVKPGSTATVVPTADASAAVPAKVAEVASVSANGQYEVWLRPERSDERLVPGQTCKVTLTGIEKRDAVTVPTTAVKRDGDKGVVHVWKDGKAVAKEVKVGGKAGALTEVVEGLDAGTSVLETAPAK